MIQTQRGLAGLARAWRRRRARLCRRRSRIDASTSQHGCRAGDLIFSAERHARLALPAQSGSQRSGARAARWASAPQARIWRAPVLRLSTRRPMVCFAPGPGCRCRWRRWCIRGRKATAPLPELPGPETGSRRLAGSLDELAALRPFREGDSPRQVAWKAYARGAPLLVREYRATPRHARIRLRCVAAPDTEQRLSQLRAGSWMQRAQNQRWTLRLPGGEAVAGAGPEHRGLCLARLALFGTAGRTHEQRRHGPAGAHADAAGLRRRRAAACGSRAGRGAWAWRPRHSAGSWRLPLAPATARHGAAHVLALGLLLLTLVSYRTVPAWLRAARCCWSWARQNCWRYGNARDARVVAMVALALLLAACLERQSLLRVPLYLVAGWLALAALAALGSQAAPGLGWRWPPAGGRCSWRCRWRRCASCSCRACRAHCGDCRRRTKPAPASATK